MTDGYLVGGTLASNPSVRTATSCVSTQDAACQQTGSSGYDGVMMCRPGGSMISATIYTCTQPAAVAPVDALGLSSIDTALVAQLFGAALLFWSIGLGLGLLIAVVRKARM